MTSEPASSNEVAQCIARYAKFVHATIGPTHHVASPLGLWMLLALAASAARAEERSKLADALGMEVDRAVASVGALLKSAHPAVSGALAAWKRHEASTLVLDAWLRGLPKQVSRGWLPAQAAADGWASRHTRRMVRSFPINFDSLTRVVLASALGSQVEWEVPFEPARPIELGAASSWAHRSIRVLRSSPGHRCSIATSGRAGDVAVHTAFSKGRDLKVTSVIAAPDVSPADVMAAAHQAADIEEPAADFQFRSLFEFPLGESPCWTMTEVDAGSGIRETATAILPAWSARSDHRFAAEPLLGFGAAGNAIAALLPPEPRGYGLRVRQSATAEFSQHGFKAAAVAGFEVRWSRQRLEQVARVATLRFGHPFAVVAVTADRPGSRLRGGYRGPWSGLPVFSAWVADPDRFQAIAPEVGDGDS
jgi:hypothetical protein